MKTATRVCNLCEAMCGLSVEHSAKDIHSIRANTQDVFSAGAYCPKSQGLADLYYDTDRIRRPLKRQGDKFVEITWDEAFTSIARKTKELQRQHGTSTIATYLGNPNSHHFGNLLALPFFLRSLRTRNKYSATSVDQLPHMLAAYLMFGHQMLIPIADVDRTEYMLILGANPAVSNGSLLSGAGLSSRIKTISKRGGKVVVIDPRHTETATLATEHHFIKPGTDAYFLAAIVQLLLVTPRLRHLEKMVLGLGELTKLINELPLQNLQAITGISLEVVQTITDDLVRYDRAVCYGRVGVSTQRFGGVCQWLINLINILTGNLDREGGTLFTRPAVDIVSLMAKSGSCGSFDRRRSRVRNLPEFSGELPAATLADEILTPGKGQVHGLFTIAGNPVLSLPNGQKLETALAGLDLYVAIDFYRNETTRFAHYILPPVSPLERDHFDLVFNAFALRNQVRFSPRLIDPPGDSYDDWGILMELWSRLSVSGNRFGRWRQRVSARLLVRLGSRFMLDLALRLGPYRMQLMSLKKIIANPNGIDLGPLKPSLPGRLFTKHKMIELCPPPFVAAWTDLCKSDLTQPSEDTLLLVGRRSLKSNNSWMHNCPSLNKARNQCYALLNTEDAIARGITDGAQIELRTEIGTITLPAKISDKIMRGVISVPHGWGHHRKGIKQSLASSTPGVSLNDILDDRVIDEFCGNAALVGQAVTVNRVDRS